MDQIKTHNCLACHSEKMVRVWQKPPYHIFRCQHCDFFSTTPKISEEQEQNLFSDHYFKGHKDNLAYTDYEQDKPFLTYNFQRRLRWLMHMGLSSGEWLDFGCALGFFTNVLHNNGFQAYGIDRVPYAIDYAKSQMGLEHMYKAYTISEAFPNKQFDVISFINVLELTTNPIKMIQDATIHLKTGGHLVLDVWNPYSFIAKRFKSKWHALTPPSQMFYFSHHFLTHYLSSQGFT